MCVTGRSRSLKIVPFESFGMFLPCDVMHKRGLCRHVVSVCPSVTSVDHVKTTKRIFKFFSPSGSQAILVFPYITSITSWHYSDGDSSNEGVECKGGWKNDDFRPISRFISEMMQDRAIVTMEGEQETALKLSNGTSLNDLEWPLTQISRSRYYSTSNNSKTVQDRAIFTVPDQ